MHAGGGGIPKKTEKSQRRGRGGGGGGRGSSVRERRRTGRRKGGDPAGSDGPRLPVCGGAAAERRRTPGLREASRFTLRPRCRNLRVLRVSQLIRAPRVCTRGPMGDVNRPVTSETRLMV